MKLYTLVPDAKFDFYGLDAMTRVVFGTLYDRFLLSCKKEHRRSFTDDTGTYCVFDRRDLMQTLGTTLPTLRRCLTVLSDRHLILMIRQGSGAGYRYYIPSRVWEYLHSGPDDDEIWYNMSETWTPEDLTPHRAFLASPEDEGGKNLSPP